MVYTSSPDYLYRRNGIYYFTRNVPSDLKTRFNKKRVVVSSLQYQDRARDCPLLIVISYHLTPQEL